MFKQLLEADGSRHRQQLSMQDGQHGASVLHLAVSKKAPTGIISLLIAARADVGQRDAYGRSALHRAAFLGMEDVVELLLKMPDCDLHMRGFDGCTALDKARAQKH